MHSVCKIFLLAATFVTCFPLQASKRKNVFTGVAIAAALACGAGLYYFWWRRPAASTNPTQQKPENASLAVEMDLGDLQAKKEEAKKGACDLADLTAVRNACCY